MEIALHLGAHLTVETQIRNCMVANADRLAAQGVVATRARNYLNTLIDAATHIASGHGAPRAFETVLEALEAPADARRLIFSAPKLLAKLPEAMDDTRFYPGAARRIAAFRHIFAGHQTEIFLAIRNPASFVPAFLNAERAKAKGASIDHLDADALRWSLVVAEIRAEWPEAALTVWCDEDTPFVWHQMLERVAGVTPEDGFAGSFDWFTSVMIDGGADKLARYLETAPPVDDAHRQRVIAAFLEKYCDPDKLDIDLTATGWDEARLDHLSALYEDDVAQIASMPGVTLVQP